MQSNIPTNQEMQIAAKSSRALSSFLTDNSQVFELKLKGSKKVLPIEIPSSALKMLFMVLTEMAEGKAITLMPIHAELTTHEAAKLLNVSRPFLINLLEENKIPYRKVGSRRKILFNDLMEYKKTMYYARKQALSELAAEGQALEQEFKSLSKSNKLDDKK